VAYLLPWGIVLSVVAVLVARLRRKWRARKAAN